jgi:hypothetical protein
MAKVDEALHKKIAAGLGDTRVSPAVLAYHMLQENLYVNESLLQYMINYIKVMANHKLMPLHLAEIKNICQTLELSLLELGLTGTVGRQPLDTTEYLAV